MNTPPVHCFLCTWKNCLSKTWVWPEDISTGKSPRCGSHRPGSFPDFHSPLDYLEVSKLRVFELGAGLLLNECFWDLRSLSSHHTTLKLTMSLFAEAASITNLHPSLLVGHTIAHPAIELLLKHTLQQAPTALSTFLLGTSAVKGFYPLPSCAKTSPIFTSLATETCQNMNLNVSRICYLQPPSYVGKRTAQIWTHSLLLANVPNTTIILLLDVPAVLFIYFHWIILPEKHTKFSLELSFMFGDGGGLFSFFYVTEIFFHSLFNLQQFWLFC